MKVTLRELASGMNVPETTLDRWIRQGRVPVRRVGTDCVFDKQALDKWARLHRIPLAPRLADTKPDSEEPRAGALSDAMARGGVLFGLSADTPDALLAEMAAGVSAHLDMDAARLLERLKARETLASTGIGKGIAIPHPRSPLENGPPDAVIVTCFPASPVDYNAIDDEPVFVFFVLLCPDTRVHLKLLSRLSYCVRDPRFIDYLKNRPDADALVARIADMEADME
ncbi:MAG: excisionase [Deltaproteobacteria bacterium]|nr:MAG: excisionase [Deltaproteobacteria bacterium]